MPKKEEAARGLAQARQAATALRTTLESIADGFLACDAEWRFVYVNAAAERLLGMRRDELLGRSHWDVFPLALGTRLEREYRSAALGQVRDFENFYEPWARWFHVRCFPREGGGVSLYFEDVTQRKAAEEQLRRARQLSEALNRIHQVLHSTLDRSVIGQQVVAQGALALGSDTATLALREAAGFRVVHAHGMPAETAGALLSDEQDRQAALAIESNEPLAVADAFSASRDCEQQLRHAARCVLVVPLVARDGPLGVLCFDYTRDSHAFTDAELHFARQLAAATSGALANARLLDERTRAEEALRQSREDLDRAQEVGQIGWWRLDTQRNVLTWSDETHRIFEVAKGTPLTYEAFLGAVHAEDRSRVDAGWAAALRGEPYDVEHRILVGRRVKWVREKAYLELDGKGGLLGGFGITQDVTDRKQAEEALQLLNAELGERVAERTAELAHAAEKLRAERQRLFDVLETLPPMICLLTADRQVAFANRAFRERFGASQGRCSETCFLRGARCELCETYRVLATGHPHRWELEAPDGRLLDTHDFPFTDVDGTPMILQMQIDITERRKAERRLRVAHAELATRAEQLRRLAGELTLAEQRERRRMAKVLHDHLQQLLVSARFRTAILGRTGDPVVARAATEIEEILDESINASRSLTAELSPPILHEGGLDVGLEWLARWMADRHALIVELSVEQPLPALLEDVKVLLFESVRELLFNAVKHARVRTVRVSLRRVEEDMLQIGVSDAGPGFDATAVDRAGGHGLITIRERLGLIGGHLEIDSKPGVGSRFTLLTPIAGGPGAVTPSDSLPAPGSVDETGPASPVLPASPLERPRKLRVLLADDHAVVREGLARLLAEEADMEVVAEAADGGDAVRLVRTLLPDVVLMDLSMPGLNGIEATRAIRNEVPETRVIGLSMFEEAERAQAMLDAGAGCFLTKSGPAADLLAAIRGELTGRVKADG